MFVGPALGALPQISETFPIYQNTNLTLPLHTPDPLPTLVTLTVIRHSNLHSPELNLYLFPFSLNDYKVFD